MSRGTTLSVVIPFMPIDEDKYAVLDQTLDSFSGADEVLVVENWKAGYAVPINFGLAQATGDFLVVMNDDLVWDGGSLTRLCDPEAVTSPRVNGHAQPFWGCAFCLPRWVYERTGGLFEGYRISYFDDDDFQNTLEHLGIPMRCEETVSLTTQGGRTLERFPDRDAFFAENRALYNQRWPQHPR